DVITDNEDDEDGEDGDFESKSIWKKYQARLRSLQEVEHVCHFFMGHMYFQMRETTYGTDLADTNAMDLNRKEQDCYDQAKAIRKSVSLYAAGFLFGVHALFFINQLMSI